MPSVLLLLPRAQAQDQIAARIDIGQGFLNETIHDETDLDRLWAERRIWHSYNKELLLSLFDTYGPHDEYSYVGPSVGGALNLHAQIQSFHRDIETHITRLRAILGKLEIYKEAPAVSSSTPVEGSPATGHAVFIVHGRAGREHEVARAVEQLGAEAVILQERLHQGSATLIEKLEREAKPCGYALVVYTGDDEGRIFGDGGDLARRARENVVLELGYFVGLLGRKNVTVLLDPDVAFPSDFDGVGYYPMDPAGAWKQSVAGELKRARIL